MGWQVTQISTITQVIRLRLILLPRARGGVRVTLGYKEGGIWNSLKVWGLAVPLCPLLLPSSLFFNP